MTIAVAISCAVFLGAVLLLYRRRRPDAPRAVDAERTTRIGVELHGVRRRLDVAWTRTQLHRDAEAARREIESLLNASDRDPDDRW